MTQATITRTSNQWHNDTSSNWCKRCAVSFNPVTNRRHHCRLCGNLFCGECTKLKSLIPPSLIVLSPHSSNLNGGGASGNKVSFTPDEDPDGVKTLEKVSLEEDSSNDAAAVAAGEGNFEFNTELRNEQLETLIEDVASLNGKSSGNEDGLEHDNATTVDNNDLSSSSSKNIHLNRMNQNYNDDEKLFEKVNIIQNGLQTPMLYGKTVEQRYKLARDPQRVCPTCHDSLAPLQPQLRASNANCVRFNAVDPTDLRRLFNSPIAFTLGHEVRKAAYTLNNLLPLPRKMGILSNSNYNNNNFFADDHMDACQEQCSTTSPNLGDLDGMRIPAKLVERAKGLAILTVARVGAGVGVEFGTGLSVARLAAGKWSAPNAIQNVGVSWGAQVGAQVSDHVFLLMTDAAVNTFFSNKNSFQLGADISVAVGPLGRSVEADLALTDSAAVYTYSLSKGLFIGASLDGKIISTRHDLNEKFYGQGVRPADLRSGEIQSPNAAMPLYDALKRCHVYAGSSNIFSETRSLQHSQAHGSNFSMSQSASQSCDRSDSTFSQRFPYEEYGDDECDIGILNCSFPLPAPPRDVNVNAGPTIVSIPRSDKNGDPVEWPF